MSSGGLQAGDPQRVSRYSVLRRLGRGGMSTVYDAYDPELDRHVALKLVTAWEHGDAQGPARLVREARAMAKISHPNVAPVYDAGVFGDAVFIAMELIDGPTLDAWAGRTARPWTEILRMYLLAGRGLAAAHDAGLVHRDFKPDNVMVGPDDRPRVLDFGLARATALDDDDSTQRGAITGTPAFMAPEQHEGEPGGPASDQFAFCVSLWEALYRQQPFPGESLFEVADAIVEGRLLPPPQFTHVPAWIRNLLERGLAVEPDARHPSMRSLLASIVFTFKVMHGLG